MSLSFLHLTEFNRNKIEPAQFTPLKELKLVAIMTGRPSVAETVHFVGSICLPDQRATTQHLCDSLASRLRRISDGETGKRENFVIFQWQIFNESPFVQASFCWN